MWFFVVDFKRCEFEGYLWGKYALILLNLGVENAGKGRFLLGNFPGCFRM
jgi:hypothetical protein